VTRFRLSLPAEADVAQILAFSRRHWGSDGRRRYARILSAAMRAAAAEPDGVLARRRDDLAPGVRSLHTRHVRREDAAASVRQPVHVVFYRSVSPDLVEIIRVLHERMEPTLHLDVAAKPGPG